METLSGLSQITLKVLFPQYITEVFTACILILLLLIDEHVPNTQRFE